MLGKFTSFPYSCINAVCRGPCGNNSTNCTAPFSPTAFAVVLSWNENSLLWFRQLWFIHFSEAYCTKKREVLHLMEIMGTCVGVREKVMDVFYKWVKLVETLLFFILKYMYGLRLPVVAGAFPEVITVYQRRRTCTTLILFLPYYCFPTMSSSLYFVCRGWATSRCPAHRMQYFPIMLILQIMVNAQSVLQHSCPQDTL